MGESKYLHDNLGYRSLSQNDEIYIYIPFFIFYMKKEVPRDFLFARLSLVLPNIDIPGESTFPRCYLIRRNALPQKTTLCKYHIKKEEEDGVMVDADP
jgi:hypothetical protein